MELPARIGKYQLEKFLGGGMSHVYRATDTVIGRTVAVKILTDQGCADPDVRARFLQEARMSGNIQHENIISIYDYGEEAGKPYMVMEFLVGQDLRDAIRSGATGDLENKLRIALQIARALEYVHSKNIVHRDIKPENVHLDESGRAKLMDFGIAKAEGMSLTRTGFSLGTPYYMAPEQVLGETVGEAADVYAFGILLYELLTGTRPLSGDTVERLFYMILNEPVDLEPLRASGVPESVIDLIARCTAKKPADRVQSFRRVRAELADIMRASEPTRTIALPVAVKKRRSGPLVVGMLVTIIAIVAGGLMWYNWPRSEANLPPTLQTDTGTMVLVPGGRFLNGKNKETAIVPTFYIDRTEVTNAAYKKFCEATSRPLPAKFPADRPNDPVVHVTISDATAFARWAGKRLPDALEWEKAARGSEGKIFPWGDELDPARANVQDNSDLPDAGLQPADSMPQSASPYGALHMIGNAIEYVRTDITPSKAVIEYFSDKKLMPQPPAINEPWYSVKGGSFTTPLSQSIPWGYNAVPARYSAPNIGFRCVKDLPR